MTVVVLGPINGKGPKDYIKEAYYPPQNTWYIILPILIERRNQRGGLPGNTSQLHRTDMPKHSSSLWSPYFAHIVRQQKGITRSNIL